MRTIDLEQLRAMMDRKEDFLMVNTLSPEQFEKTKIPGAVNIPQQSDDFAQRVEQEAGGKESTVVVYCASTECDSSRQAAEKLEAFGFTDVLDFEAGAKGWTQRTASAANR